MRKFVGRAAVIGLLTVSAENSTACALVSTLNLDNVHFADFVVVGRISNYRVHLERLDGSVSPSAIGLFDLQVDQVLKGKAPHSISVAIDDRGQGLSPKVAKGLQLVAMRIAESGAPRAPSSAWGQLIPLSEARWKFSVMREPCEPPFIVDARSNDAFAVMRALKDAE